MLAEVALQVCYPERAAGISFEWLVSDHDSWFLPAEVVSHAPSCEGRASRAPNPFKAHASAADITLRQANPDVIRDIARLS